MENEILLEIQKSIGNIEATLNSVKEDITELKAKDLRSEERLEATYNKAMEYARTRQDGIRDNLQSQISNLDTRLKTIETKKEKTLVKLYDKIIDKIAWLFILGAIAVLLKWLGVPSEIANQLP